jgi:hypothetical protein
MANIAKRLEYQCNILATFLRATPAQIVDGKNWYPEARKIVGSKYSHAPAVFAVLSPRITWQENIKGAEKILKAASQGLSVIPRVVGIRSNVEKAWAIAQDGDVSRVSGPKVSAFFANLSGNDERVTIDVWAARAAGVSDKEMSHLDRQRYVNLEAAYVEVARVLGFKPSELQAICWIVVRGKAN